MTQGNLDVQTCAATSVATRTWRRPTKPSSAAWTLLLRLVAVNGTRIDPDALKRAGKATAGDLRVDEDDDLLERLVFFDLRVLRMSISTSVFAIRDLKDLLSNRVGRLILTGDFDFANGSAEEVLHGDVGRERSRKTSDFDGWPAETLRMRLMLAQEAHVEHAVSLVSTTTST